MLDKITNRQATEAEFGKVVTFYRRTAYYGEIQEGDCLFVAEIDGTILGAARLCHEEGHLVLRGVRLLYTRRRRAIATRLLGTVTGAIGERSCYALPFAYLAPLYGQIGFCEIPPSQAPSFLRERFAAYRQRGLDVLLMGKNVLAGGA